MAEVLLGNSELTQTNSQAILAGFAWATLWEATKGGRLETITIRLNANAQTATSIRVALFTSHTAEGSAAASPLPTPLVEAATTVGIVANGKPEVLLPNPVELVKGRNYYLALMPLGGEIHISHKVSGALTPTAAKTIASKSLLSESAESNWEAKPKEGLFMIEGVGTVSPPGTLREKIIDTTPPGATQALGTNTTELAAVAAGTVQTISMSAAAPAGLQGGQFRAVIGLPTAKGEVELGEYLLVTSATSTTWTVERGAEGPAPVAHAVGQTLYHVVTVAGLEKVASEQGPLDIAKCKGVDPTGVKDSTLGIMEARIQALAEKRTLKAASGRYKVEGIVELGGVGMQGVASGSTTFFKNSTDGKMFTISTSPASVRDFSIENENHEATVGSFIIVETQNLELSENVFSNEVKIENVTLHQPFNGFEVRNTGGTYFRQVVCENVVNSALWTHAKNLEQLFNTFVFAANEKITTEGKSNAILMKLEGENSGSVFENGEILLGKSGLQATGLKGEGATGKLSFVCFSNCFFDSSREPVLLANSKSCKFQQCWFAVRPAGGVQLKESENIHFIGCEITGCGTYCMQIDEKSSLIRLVGSALGGGEAAGSPNVEVLAASRFTITGCNFVTTSVANQCIEIKTGVSESKAYNITNNVSFTGRKFLKDNSVKTEAERNGIVTGNVGQEGKE